MMDLRRRPAILHELGCPEVYPKEDLEEAGYGDIKNSSRKVRMSNV